MRLNLGKRLRRLGEKVHVKMPRTGEGGGSGVRWGTHVHLWLIHVNVWQNPLQYCKVISLQLKKKKNLTTVHYIEKKKNAQDDGWLVVN